MTQIAQTTIPLNISKDFLCKTKKGFLLKIFKYGIRVRKLLLRKRFFMKTMYTQICSSFSSLLLTKQLLVPEIEVFNIA